MRSFSLRFWASSPHGSSGELHATPQAGRPCYSCNQVPIIHEILSARLAAGSLVLCGQIVGGETMGDKGGKKDKQKEQKRKTDQKQHDAKVKQDKQPKRKTG